MQFYFLLTLFLLLFVTQLTGAYFKITDCDAELHQMIRHALLKEIPAMLEVAQEKLSSLLEDLKLPGSDALGSYRNRVVRRTLSSLIFSPIENFNSHETTMGIIRSHSIDFVSRVSKNVEVLRRRLGTEELKGFSDSSAFFEISCDPHWLHPVLSQGVPSDTFFDLREPRFSEKLTAITIPGGIDLLKKESSEVSLTLNNMSLPFTTVVLLNSHMKGLWRIDSTPASPHISHMYRASLEALRDSRTWRGSAKFPYSNVYLGQIVRHHLSALLIRALAGSRDVLEDEVEGTSGLLANRCVREPANDTAVWRCMELLALREPKIAVRNALNFQYLIVALFMPRINWSFGFGQQLDGKSAVDETRLEHWQQADEKLALIYPDKDPRTYKLGNVKLAWERTKVAEALSYLTRNSNVNDDDVMNTS